MTEEVGEHGEAAAGFWSARASAYDDHYDATGADGYSLRARAALTLRLVGDGPGRALDVGMGAGRLCEGLSLRGWTVFGVDPAPQMVALAQRRLPEAAERLELAAAESLPFADDSFEVVTATGSLEYTDVPRALAEVSRVLRPGGRAVVTYPNPRALYALWKTHVWYRVAPLVKRMARRPAETIPRNELPLTPRRFAGLLQGAGLAVETVRFSSYLVLPSPLDEFLPRAAESLGRRVEARPAMPLARWLGTQAVYVARKDDAPAAASASPSQDVEERADR